MTVTWNYDRAEIIADGIVHAIGIALGIAGAVILLVIALHAAHHAEIAPIIIYIVGLLSMLGLSAAYNLWPISPRKWLLRRFDHSSIYLLIAATYTPFIWQMKSGFVPTALLIVVWMTAAAGIVLKLAWPERFDGLSIVLYLVLGWSGILAYGQVAEALQPVDAMADYYRRRALLRRRAVSPLGTSAISYGDLARLRAHRRALPLHGRAVLRDAGELIRRYDWSGRRESNPRMQLGKLPFYH